MEMHLPRRRLPYLLPHLLPSQLALPPRSLLPLCPQTRSIPIPPMALRAIASRKTLAALGSGLRAQARLATTAAAAAASRGLVTFSLPDLPYDYGALEPAVSAEIMQLHHQKHHQSYVTNYNKALEQLEDAVARDDAPAVVKLQSAIKFNGGGHINHSIFWKNLAPIHEGGGEPPKGSLGWAIDADFGSWEAFVQKMNAEGAALQGSGWVWLGLDKEFKKLVVETTANQVSFSHLRRTLSTQLLFLIVCGKHINLVRMSLVFESISQQFLQICRGD
ncbi:superoxide dismutase [Mn], mitochondrial isoform X2 [Eucalyptus grandis]|uniref:superoxide dismutase [Mn], mitochondrial isoform X2 n=1 Tax=Eucalyptus grandis TaxID=71139 RepID=UPI00192F03D8|nr:superoxide dismutase [Mn], mitochondrial isoform X2 [Eucalyptus grandis]